MKKKRLTLTCICMAGVLFCNSMSAFATQKTQEQYRENSENEEKDEYVITEFKELEDNYLELKGKIPLPELQKKFPTCLTVELDGEETTDIPVMWECTDDYEETDYDFYEFMPQWDEEKYVLSDDADVPYMQVMVPLAVTEEERLYIEAAKESLNELLEKETVFALVYLCERYDLKEEADSESDTVVSVLTGTTVKIKGMSLDAGRTVWYKVEGLDGDETYTGYIKRDYLAYSNEVFRAWEEEKLSLYTAKLAPFSLAYADVEQFPESYQGKLMAIKRQHPNWVFVKQSTGIDWQKAVKGESYKDRSLISDSMKEAYKGEKYSEGWYYASGEAIAYYMDPRNFLDETRVFQFEQLTFNHSYHTKDAVQNILNGTFMSGNIPNEEMTYAKAFYEIGAALGVSPFHLASRVYQEQGKGTSPLISGEYEDYEGYYNYFNVGASGKTVREVIVTGLTYAKNRDWDTRYKALKGGASVLAANYILKGQDTVYLQKFNVDGRYYSLYTHQYMQNIRAPYTEAPKIKQAYANAGALENPFVFKIPVYNNMPAEACPVPGTVVKPTATPTVEPTATPTVEPTATPTAKPTATATPTAKPAATATPTATPTAKPTATPTVKPTVTPTAKPTATPTAKPTVTPTAKPTATPTAKPTATPTVKPTATATPTAKPTATPTAKPTATATVRPTAKPTATPTAKPTATPTAKPTATATVRPTAKPTATPTVKPTATPTAKPTATATVRPTAKPTATPTAKPTATATVRPTAKPTVKPTATATVKPTATPTATPTAKPTATPTAKPTATATVRPTAKPTATPTAKPTATPTAKPTAKPTVTPKAEEHKRVSMDMKENTKVFAGTLERVREEGTQVVLNMSETVTWTIDGNKMSSEPLEDIDFAVTLGSSDIPKEKIKELLNGENAYVELSLAHEGSFGFDAILTVSLDEAKSGEYANLFYYDESIGEFRFMCASPVNANGKAAFNFKHASDYVIIVSEQTLENKTELIQEKIKEHMQDDAKETEEIKPWEDSESTLMKQIGLIILIILGSVALVIGAVLVLSRKE